MTIADFLVRTVVLWTVVFLFSPGLFYNWGPNPEDFEIKKEQAMSGLKNLGNMVLGKFGMSLDNFKLNQNRNGSYNIQYQT